MTHSSRRHRVLEALRRSVPAPVPLPAVAPDLRPGVAPDPQPGRLEDVERHLVRAGALVRRLESERDVADALAAHAPFEAARRVVSTVPGIPGAELAAPPGSGADSASGADPHAYADVDIAIARGDFAVAENGAIWVTDAAVPHRALYFLAQHLVLLVPSDAVVADLHAAYARIGLDRGSPATWSAFIAGPSKTADIEQALVVGAHGPRSLLVLLH